MNMQSLESLIEEIDQRNKRIHELKAEIETIYMAARPLIDHAKQSGEGNKALMEWDKLRP